MDTKNKMITCDRCGRRVALKNVLVLNEDLSNMHCIPPAIFNCITCVRKDALGMPWSKPTIEFLAKRGRQ